MKHPLRAAWISTIYSHYYVTCAWTKNDDVSIVFFFIRFNWNMFITLSMVLYKNCWFIQFPEVYNCFRFRLNKSYFVWSKKIGFFSFKDVFNLVGDMAVDQKKCTMKDKEKESHIKSNMKRKETFFFFLYKRHTITNNRTNENNQLIGAQLEINRWILIDFFLYFIEFNIIKW